MTIDEAREQYQLIQKFADDEDTDGAQLSEDRFQTDVLLALTDGTIQKEDRREIVEIMVSTKHIQFPRRGEEIWYL